MKITLELDEVSQDGLNSALLDFSKVLNQHFVASGNTIHLKDEGEGTYDKYDTLKDKDRYKWILRVRLEWMRVPYKDKT